MSNLTLSLAEADCIGLGRGSIGAWIRNIDAEDHD